MLLCTVNSDAYKMVNGFHALTALTDNSIKFNKLIECVCNFFYKKPSLLVAKTEFVQIKKGKVSQLRDSL